MRELDEWPDVIGAVRDVTGALAYAAPVGPPPPRPPIERDGGDDDDECPGCGQIPKRVKCTDCGGDGRVHGAACEWCNGEGVEFICACSVMGRD
jgi:hypothetical protein